VRPVPDRFSCMLYADYDPRTYHLAFSNAGAPFLLMASRAECSSIGEGGIPSGMFSDVTYNTYRLKLNQGDAILFATAGIDQLQNEKGEDIAWNVLGGGWQHADEKRRRGARLFVRGDSAVPREWDTDGRYYGGRAEGYGLARNRSNWDFSRGLVADAEGSQSCFSVIVERDDDVGCVRVVCFGDVAGGGRRAAIRVRMVDG